MNQKPDFQALQNYLTGRAVPGRLHLADLLIDDTVLEQYTLEVLNRKWIPRETDQEGYFRNYAQCFCHMGFDYVPFHFWIQNTFKNFPQPETWIAHDKGLITTEAEFEAFPWDDIYVDYSGLDILAKCLPEGMKIAAVTGDFQDLMDCIIGTVSFLMMIYDNPELLDKLINRWYGIKRELFRRAVQHQAVGVLFTCADFGSSHSTLVSPDFIVEKLIPWYRQFAEIAHDAGKMYWFHSCGEIYGHRVIDRLIEDVGIDAFHSFQDSILPVPDFLRRYGDRVAALGGVDLDKLCTLPEEELRAYLRTTIRESLAAGRYAFGTGNSVPNYVPFKNWLILLEEAANYNLEDQS